MKNKIFILATILFVISIISTPFVFKLMDKTDEIPESIIIATEETSDSIEIKTEIIETTISPATEVVETTEPAITPTTEATEATEVVIETTMETTMPIETEPVEENPIETTEGVAETEPKTVINEVPLYNQWDYPDVFYGEREGVSVATHGDGMTTMAMIASYLKDEPTLTPDVIANMFGYHDSNQGTSWALFTDAAEVLELGEVRQAWDWNVGEIEKALREGSIVACCLGRSIFSENGGRYILLTGITEDGKIMVNDSNGYNYDSTFLKPMFKNGFDAKYIYEAGKSYWIYIKQARKPTSFRW